MIYFEEDDRIPVKIDDVTFWVSSLDQNQKAKLAVAIGFDSGKKVTDTEKLHRCCIQYCVKRVDGVTKTDGSKFTVHLNKKGILTEKSVDAVLRLGCSAQLARAASVLWNGIKELDMPGVTVDIKGTMPEKKLESLSL